MRAGRTRTERLGIGIFGLLIAIESLRAALTAPELPALRRRSDDDPAPGEHGEALTSARHCPPLGIEPTLEGTSVTSALRPGGGVLLYTDGLPEARTARDVERRGLFGEHAARDTLVALQGAPPADAAAQGQAA